MAQFCPKIENGPLRTRMNVSNVALRCTRVHQEHIATNSDLGTFPFLPSFIKSISVFLCLMSDCQRCKNTSTERDLVPCLYPEIIRLGKRSGISQVQHGRTGHSSVPSRAGGMVLHHFRRHDSIVQSCGPPRYTFCFYQEPDRSNSDSNCLTSDMTWVTTEEDSSK